MNNQCYHYLCNKIEQYGFFSVPVKPILHREEVSSSEMHKVLQIVLAGYEKGQGNLFHWVAMYDKLQYVLFMEQRKIQLETHSSLNLSNKLVNIFTALNHVLSWGLRPQDWSVLIKFRVAKSVESYRI